MADTDIVLTVGLNVKDAEKTAEQLQKEVKNIFESRDGVQSSSLTSLEMQMKKTYQQVENITEKMKELAKTEVPTERYAQLSAELDKYDKQYDSLMQKMVAFEEAGGDVSSDKYQAWAKEMEHIELSAKNISDRMEKMKTKGTAFISGADTAEYAKLKSQLDSINDKLKKEIIRHREITTGIKRSTKETERLKNATDKVRKSSKSMSSSISSGFMTIAKGAKKAVVAIAALLLGVRGFMAIFNKVRSAIKEGFDNLAQSNVSKLKNQMEDLKASAATMKNALAGAFEPIVTMIIPYIQKLVEWLTIAIDKMAQFIAALSGQKTYIKAIKQAGNAAEKAGGQASKALGSFDKLNVITSQSGAGGGGGFTTAEIPSDVFDALEKFKEKLKEIKDIIDEYVVKPFMAGFTSALGDNWKDKIDDIKTNLGKIRDAIIEIMSDPEVQASSMKVFESLMYSSGQIAGSATRIGLNIGQNVVGGVAKYLEDHKQDIIDDTVEINNLVADAVKDAGDMSQAVGEISDAIGSEEGQGLTASFLNLGQTASSELGKILLKLHLISTHPVVQTVKENVDGIREALENLFAFITPVVDIVTGIVEGTLGIINKGLDGIRTVLAEIQPFVSRLFGEILAWWNDEDGPGPWLTEQATEFKEIFETDIKPILEDLGDLLQGLFEIISITFIPLWYGVIIPAWNTFKNIIWPVLKLILTKLLDLIKAILILLTNAVSTVTSVIRTITSIINKFFRGDLKGCIEDAIYWFTELKTKWSSAKDRIMGILDSLSTGWANTFGGIQDWIEGLIQKLAWFAGEVEDKLGPVFGLIGGGLSTVGSVVGNIFSGGFGGAANGAVIPPYVSEHLIKVGDNKSETEVVSPLSTMQQAMLGALQQAGFSGNGNQEIVLQLDGREFMRAMIKQNDEIQKRTGNPAW